MKLFKVIRTTACGVKFATRVGITVGSNLLQGVANVADVPGRAAKKTARGDWDGLERLAERTARGVGRSIENKCTAAGELFSEAERCIANPDRRFLTKKNAAGVDGSGHGGGGRLGAGSGCRLRRGRRRTSRCRRCGRCACIGLRAFGSVG